MVYGSNGYKACSQSCSCCADCCIKVFPGVLPLAKHFWQNSHICPWHTTFPRGYIYPWHKLKLQTAHAVYRHFNFKIYIFSLSTIFYLFYFPPTHFSGVKPLTNYQNIKNPGLRFPKGKPLAYSVPFPGVCDPCQKTPATDHISCSEKSDK
jgi:hypothetical protein